MTNDFKQYGENILPMPERIMRGGQARQEAIQAAAEGFKFSIRNPLVLLGASIVVASSVLLGIKASERISQAKDSGEPISGKDRMLQTFGFAGAAAVISAALLMGQTGSKGRA